MAGSARALLWPEPTVSFTSIYGDSVARDELEAAVLATIQPWIGAYLADAERKRGMPAHTIPVPPAPQSFHGGIDFDTWRQGLEPVIIVNPQPYGPAERHGSGQYKQEYEIRVAAVCVADEKFADAAAVDIQEDAARHLADLYGAALQLLLTQQGGFSGTGATPFVERTTLYQAPTTEWINPDVRRVARSVTVVRSWVAGIADEAQGPRTPPANPYLNPGNWPTASLVKFGLTTESLFEVASAPTGATVTDDDGDVQVAE